MPQLLMDDELGFADYEGICRFVLPQGRCTPIWSETHKTERC